MKRKAVKYEKLVQRIKKKFGTVSKFSRKINKSAESVSNKLRGESQIPVEEAFLWAKELEISDIDFLDYFRDISI
ncbi:hypothetical protein [Enterococcus timonensis]|uniref:hypothetical protein n=1 Tax=Enterococcus timonensis TaxID=1852364 RepID=UPI0008D93508|nr:hypothetical protein [Enterococcus timonensis]